MNTVGNMARLKSHRSLSLRGEPTRRDSERAVAIPASCAASMERGLEALTDAGDVGHKRSKRMEHAKHYHRADHIEQHMPHGCAFPRQDCR